MAKVKVRGKGSVYKMERGKSRGKCRKWQLRAEIDGEFEGDEGYVKTRVFHGTYSEAQDAKDEFVAAIERGEDRIEFKHTMDSLGIEMARSEVAYTVDEAVAIADKLGYPVVLRPAYTMGGAGGGLVYNVEELKTVVARGLQASLVGQVLVEESILGWEELELEVVQQK